MGKPLFFLTRVGGWYMVNLMSDFIPLIFSKIPSASIVISDLINVLCMYLKSNSIHPFIDANIVSTKARLDQMGVGGF